LAARCGAEAVLRDGAETMFSHHEWELPLEHLSDRMGGFTAVARG